jgi:uncharacterized protein YdcH (DUF465 family)
MEKRDEELIARLAEENETLKKCIDEHQQYEKQLEQYNRRLYLTTEEWMDRRRIQKLKLAGRDKIERILVEYRRAQEQQRSQSSALESSQPSS